uniref:uncharacterized protein LOC117611058 n=1 Tax=Osmia lignaria TaxID=473952 RepID=UPI00147808E8|nr:uncharacterized protein LOC117611058 [Osmia lignaria]
MTSSNTFADLLREQEEVGGWIQRFWNNVCKLGKDKITWAVLEHRKGLLERYWDNFMAEHRKLMRCQEASASAYVQQDLFSVVEEAYLQAAAMILQCQTDRSCPGSPGGRQAPSEVTRQLQLPKIELPTFSGDPLKWESFRDLFRSLVHDVEHLPDVQKLLYLKSSLT